MKGGSHAPKYNSQELDLETGYYFYNARHYDPEISRFVTADNVIDGEFDTQGWNRYMYCHGNPVQYKDPTGHDAETLTDNLRDAANNDDVVDPGKIVADDYLNDPGGTATKDKVDEQIKNDKTAYGVKTSLNKVDVVKRVVLRTLSNMWASSLGNVGHVDQETQDKHSIVGAPKTKEEILGDGIAYYTEAVGAVLGAKIGLNRIKGKAESTGAIEKEIITRKTKGGDGAASRHIIEREDSKTISKTHQVEKNGEVIHQHQDHVGKYGTQRSFPDEWVEYPRVDKK